MKSNTLSAFFSLLFFLQQITSGYLLARGTSQTAPAALDAGIDAISNADNITSTEYRFVNGTATKNELLKAFGAVMALPDSTLDAGDNATANWLTAHGYHYSPGPQPAVIESPDGWWQDTECALAIAAFIGSNLVSAAKLIRIKSEIEALGGVVEAAELFLKATTWAERLKMGGEALVMLAGEILGVPIIQKACT